MSFRAACIAGVCALAMAFPATAQIEDTGLGMVDPWGMGFLDRDEPALPTSMWTASRTEDLLPLMQRVRTRGLTPVERTLMRRMALSPARKPTGAKSAELLAERARIMFELGEADAAAQLMARLETSPRGLNSEEISTDLNLALGNEATACAKTRSPMPDEPYWAKLRAVCAALSGNTAGAELAIEIAQVQGVKDSWLFNAVFAASGDMPNPPPARFDTGLNSAISAKAGLEAPVKTISLPRPDLAAAMATRPNLPAALRVRAAGIAAEAGLMDDADYRRAFNDLLKEEDFKPTRSLERAMSVSADASKTNADKARAIAMALKSSLGSPARFSAAARLMRQDMSRLPRNADTAADALLFARASIAAGDIKGAGRWASAQQIEGGPTPDPLESAILDGLVILGGADTAPASVDYVTQRLLKEAKTTAQKQDVARLMALWTAFGIQPTSEGRALILSDTFKGSELKPGALLSARAAGRAGAAGEVILATVGFTNGDPSKLNTADLALIIEALQAIGAEDVARQLALEATGYWKP